MYNILDMCGILNKLKICDYLNFDYLNLTHVTLCSVYIRLSQ